MDTLRVYCSMLFSREAAMMPTYFDRLWYNLSIEENSLNDCYRNFLMFMKGSNNITNISNWLSLAEFYTLTHPVEKLRKRLFDSRDKFDTESENEEENEFKHKKGCTVIESDSDENRENKAV